MELFVFQFMINVYLRSMSRQTFRNNNCYECYCIQTAVLKLFFMYIHQRKSLSIKIDVIGHWGIFPMSGISAITNSVGHRCRGLSAAGGEDVSSCAHGDTCWVYVWACALSPAATHDRHYMPLVYIYCLAQLSTTTARICIWNVYFSDVYGTVHVTKTFKLPSFRQSLLNIMSTELDQLKFNKSREIKHRNSFHNSLFPQMNDYYISSKLEIGEINEAPWSRICAIIRIKESH